jgi:AraC-like DNA-binding protein
VRREQAMALLRRTRQPVKQIALAVGFDNEKSFARAFRQWTGQAPSAFRREGDAGGEEAQR